MSTRSDRPDSLEPPAVFFDYDLAPDRIAQTPTEPRDASRVLVVDRARRSLAHYRFSDLPDLLNPNDLLVLNDTRVVPARLVGQRARSGGKWEGLFLRQREDGLWELLCQTRGRLLTGETIRITPGPLSFELRDRGEGGSWIAEPSIAGPAHAVLATCGQVPLPPYIRKGRPSAADIERYQTVYARLPGSIAAPTAGLHFTPLLFDRLGKRGIAWTTVTLHVGMGTFRPVETPDFRQHVMHAEWCSLDEQAAAALRACRQRGGRIVAVGTTTARVLETAAARGGIAPWSGETRLYIQQPYAFQLVDALITNFHLPKSTLLLLADALAGSDLLREAYEAAIAEDYRFYSYGDAMLIV